MKKKALALVVSLALVLGVLSGCTQEEEQQSSSGGTESIKIGAILPLSSSAGVSGARIRAGMEFAAAEINEAGGIGGKQVEIIFEDIGASDPALAISAAEKLIHQDDVSIIVGCYGSSASLAVLPICEENEIVMLEPIATSAALTSGSEWIFRISSTNSIDAEMLGQYLPALGFNKIAYLPVDNDWGVSVTDSYIPILEAAGAETVLTMPITIGETNYLSQLTKIKASGADSIIITQDVEACATLIRQIKEAGMDDFTILSTSGNNASMVYSLIGEAGTGCYFVEYYAEYGMEGGGDSPENQAFTEAFEKANSDTAADYFVVQGYTAVQVIAQAVEAAGSSGRTEIRDAMAEIRYEGLRGTIEFDEVGQSHGDVILTRLKEGGTVEVIDYQNP